MRKILNYNDLGDNTAVFDVLRELLRQAPDASTNALSSTLMGTPHKNTWTFKPLGTLQYYLVTRYSLHLSL